jgi:hypothetical protein
VHPREEESMRKTIIVGLALGVALAFGAQGAIAGPC